MKDLKRIYFLGIGGIGMSALARFFHAHGAQIFGCDKTSTELTQALEREGMEIHYDDNPSKIPGDLDLVVWTPAIPKDQKELNWFINNGFDLKKRAEVLGIISESKKTVAIAGTHGKTTTSSITTHLLRAAGLDCSAFLGGIATNFGSNYVEGKSDWVVVEADEYDRSFLHLSPDVAVILSMDPDHLDIYGDAASVLETGYLAFAKKIKEGGKVLVNVDFAQHFDNQQIETFGIESGDHAATNIRVEEGFMVFDFVGKNKKLEKLQFTLPGKHNVLNATAAIAVALRLGLDEAGIREGLATFKGIRRRFEFLARSENGVYIDDYAHHPTELKAAIAAARMFFPGKKLTGIFQPHLYSRTRDFADGFAEALDQLDEILLLEIYPARELPIEGVSSKMLVERMKNKHVQIVPKAGLLDILKNQKPELLMTLGAGDIDNFREPIRELFQNNF